MLLMQNFAERYTTWISLPATQRRRHASPPKRCQQLIAVPAIIADGEELYDPLRRSLEGVAVPGDPKVQAPVTAKLKCYDWRCIQMQITVNVYRWAKYNGTNARRSESHVSITVAEIS